MNIQLINGDCLEEMAKLPEGSIDLVLTDPPYGTTACKWDNVIPFEPMWKQLKRVTKKNAAIALFGSQPFTSALVMSNPKMFKYCLIWDKGRGREPQLSNIRPMKCHEDICIFCQTKTTYNPQKIKLDKPDKRGINPVTGGGQGIIKNYVNSPKTYNDRFPLSITKFSGEQGLHPTQKPVALMEYLIKTYTNEGDTVLDFTMGSGTTGVACKNTNRNFIGIELDKGYFDIASKRIAETIVNDNEPFCLK